MQYEVSLTVCMGRIAIQRKVSNCCHLKLQVRITKYLMCTYEGHRCTCVPNMKFVCLTLWLGEVCTDGTNADANINANTDRMAKIWHSEFI